MSPHEKEAQQLKLSTLGNLWENQQQDETKQAVQTRLQHSIVLPASSYELGTPSRASSKPETTPRLCHMLHNLCDQVLTRV